MAMTEQTRSGVQGLIRKQHAAAMAPAGLSVSDTAQHVQRTCRISDLDPPVSVQPKVDIPARLRGSRFPKRHTSLPDPSGLWGNKFETLSGLLAKGSIIVLIGRRGRGKTQMATSLAACAIKMGASPIRYEKALGFFVDLRRAYQSDSVTEDSILSTYRSPDLLVLDEVHERGNSDWENRMLTHVVDRRYDDIHDTILVWTSEDAETWAAAKQRCIDAIGESITQRAIETGGFVNCDWPDFRAHCIQDPVGQIS